jgi:hypothetical protein
MIECVALPLLRGAAPAAGNAVTSGVPFLLSFENMLPVSSSLVDGLLRSALCALVLEKHR